MSPCRTTTSDGSAKSSRAVAAARRNKPPCRAAAGSSSSNQRGKGLSSGRGPGLGAHRRWLDVKPFNDRARALYRSEGFVEEGLLRDALREPDGSFQDLVIMSILRPEWAP